MDYIDIMAVLSGEIATEERMFTHKQLNFNFIYSTYNSPEKYIQIDTQNTVTAGRKFNVGVSIVNYDFCTVCTLINKTSPYYFEKQISLNIFKIK